MPNHIMAPILSSPTTTCLKVDSAEWKVFVALMRDEGRSASDVIREHVRKIVNEHNREQANAGQPRG